MKRLTLVRHAKSDWGTEFLKDIDRPLNDRGYGDAYMQSKWYSASHPPPDRIISSTATRALNTALIFARQMNFKMDRFQLEERVYEASLDELLNLVQEQDDAFNHLMFFGHNPGFTNLCNELSKELFFDNLPTCALVSLSFDIKNWENLRAKSGDISFYQFPKEFKNKN